jgi:hypothetical protein
MLGERAAPLREIEQRGNIQPFLAIQVARARRCQPHERYLKIIMVSEEGVFLVQEFRQSATDGAEAGEYEA